MQICNENRETKALLGNREDKNNFGENTGTQQLFQGNMKTVPFPPPSASELFVMYDLQY